MSARLEVVIARAPGSMIFGRGVAERLVGQRIRLESGAPIATIKSARLTAAGREVRGTVEFAEPEASTPRERPA